MASGRTILPLSEPCLDNTGAPVSGAILQIQIAGTGTLADLFSDSGLSAPISNPQTSNAAGRFFQQTEVIWADASQSYDCYLSFPDGETFEFPNISLLGPGANTSGFAPINSPILTGNPQGPTPALNDNSSSLATTSFVKGEGYATLASPALSGIPTGPTAAPGTNTTQLATMAALEAAISINTTGSGTAITYPGGLIHQFGTSSAISQNSGLLVITLPIPFPTAAFLASAQVSKLNASPGTFAAFWPDVVAASTTTITIIMQATITGSQSNALPVNWSIWGH